jgi:hypothetical protein
MNIDNLIEKKIEGISSRLSDAELEYMIIAGKRLAEIWKLTDSELKEWLYSAEYLDDVSSDINKVKRILQKAHNSNIQDMVNLYDDITDTVYQEGTSIAVEKGQFLLPFEEFKATFNPMLKNVVNHYQARAKSTAVNEEYKRTIGRFVNRIVGDEDRINAPTAMRKAVRELSDQGISTIEFASGRKMRMDSAVRTAMMGEFTNVVQNIERKLAEDLNAGGVEISAHIAPAVDHAEIQGQVFLNEEFEKLQNGELATDIDGGKHQTDRAIGQYNCKHLWFPFFIGISERAYDPERLEDILQRNEDGVEFHGKHYSLYEATQLQRSIETEARYEREHNNLLKQVRHNAPEFEHDYQKSKTRLTSLQDEYKELGKILQPAAIRMKKERGYVPRGSTGINKTPPTDSSGLLNLANKQYLDQEQTKSDSFYKVCVNRNPEAKAAIKSYNTKGYPEINRALAGTIPMSPKLSAKIDEIDKLTKLYGLDRDIIIYRGTDMSYFQKGWEIGNTEPLKIFASSSAREDEAFGFALRNNEPLFLELRVAKGTRGVYIGNNTFFKDNGQKTNQFEFLLGKDLNYTVISKEIKNGIPHWIMEVRND